MSITIHLNGESTELANGLTADGLVEKLGLRGQRLAMEVNGEVVPRSEHATHLLEDGDSVEIVHAVGGG